METEKRAFLDCKEMLDEMAQRIEGMKLLYSLECQYPHIDFEYGKQNLYTAYTTDGAINFLKGFEIAKELFEVKQDVYAVTSTYEEDFRTFNINGLFNTYEKAVQHMKQVVKRSEFFKKSANALVDEEDGIAKSDPTYNKMHWHDIEIEKIELDR